MKRGLNVSQGFALEHVPVKIATQPKMPNKEEVEQHNYTHNPYRSWCPSCVAGKSDDIPHFANSNTRAVPVVSMDDAFTGKDAKTNVVCYDEQDKMVWAMSVVRKGNVGVVA